MKLRNSDKAIIEVEKLRDYCLNKEHPVGKHKALVFENKLGLTSNDHNEFREILFDAIINNEARESFWDNHGKRFYVDFNLKRLDFSATIEACGLLEAMRTFQDLQVVM